MVNEDNLIGNSKSMVDFLGNEYRYDCLSCSISKKKIELPGGIIYEDEFFMIGSDPEVPINGFIVINAKKHINSIIELNVEQQHKLIELINKTIKILKDLKITKEVTIVQEERSKHLHIWIFPNQKWMSEKFGKGVSHLRDICSYAINNATEADKKQVLDTIEKIKIEWKKRD